MLARNRVLSVAPFRPPLGEQTPAQTRPQQQQIQPLLPPWPILSPSRVLGTAACCCLIKTIEIFGTAARCAKFGLLAHASSDNNFVHKPPTPALSYLSEYWCHNLKQYIKFFLIKSIFACVTNIFWGEMNFFRVQAGGSN